MTAQTPAPATPQAPVLAQDATLGALQAQLSDLRVQLSGLQAQWRGLKTQLDNMLRSNPARLGVQQQWADVGVQIARVQGDIATLQARIAIKQGLPVGTPSVSVPPPSGWTNPDTVVPVVGVLSLVLILPMSIAWSKRIVRRTPRPTPIPNDVTMRLERIEQAVDTIAIEVERISEGQRFVTRIMVDRPPKSAAGDAPAGEDAAARQQQPLALGAGAMEPIVVPDREKVRQ
jgi:hypothetical protein